jgi:hypothetical protein
MEAGKNLQNEGFFAPIIFWIRSIRKIRGGFSLSLFRARPGLFLPPSLGSG